MIREKQQEMKRPGMGLLSGWFGEEKRASDTVPCPNGDGAGDLPTAGGESAGTAIPVMNVDAARIAPPPIVSEALRHAISRLKGEAPAADRTPPDRLARLLPVTAAYARERDAEEAVPRMEAEQAMENPQPGQWIEGRGVYVGLWAPAYRDGTSLGKVFNLFAAPTDLLDDQGEKALINHRRAIQHIGDLRDWHGHDGIGLPDEEAIYEQIRLGRYTNLKNWFMPPHDVLYSDLYRYKDEGGLKGTFAPVAAMSTSNWYWSSSLGPGQSSDDACCTNFSDGFGSWTRRSANGVATRVVRAELIP
jgi:hypothetical protein